jgi:hypothetical protein
MFKGKMAVLTLAVALLVVSSTAFAGIIDPCNSSALVILSGAPSLPVTLAACPQGDGGSLIAQGWYISLTIQDGLGNGIPNIPPSDFWMDDCDAAQTLIVLCGGSASSGADSLTNALGQTTMSNTQLAASTIGGPVGCHVVPPPDGPCNPEPLGSARCSDGVILIVQGEILEDPSASCSVPECYDVNVRSFDLTGDGEVSGADLSTFAIGYPGGAGTPNPCIDYDGSGTANLPDLTTFALHFGPPGHSCN